MNFLIQYLKERRKLFLWFLFFCGIFLVAFLLYHLPAGAVCYPALVCSVCAMLGLILDYRKARKNHQKLLDIRALSAELAEEMLPEAATLKEEDYQELIRMLCQEQRELSDHMEQHYSDLVDYYTIWVHQIKTPIASMRLKLQNEDTPLSRTLRADLFRIEQYVEMVLTYLRLDSDTTDYVIREYDLDGIIRQAVRKYAGEFIDRKLELKYEALKTSVLSDEKWLTFVIEQVLSNALKYTRSGSIAIDLEKPKTLCIRDTGIGIAPEDLPRIFEKGYTGYNGRSDKKASGIGLYLCR
ncbi:MAG: sensor histidine kinase, partial [Lachnospiraceae bacterium]|nr:sensor histidine kinase [Lachnospiraceae bacterium]